MALALSRTTSEIAAKIWVSTGCLTGWNFQPKTQAFQATCWTYGDGTGTHVDMANQALYELIKYRYLQLLYMLNGKDTICTHEALPARTYPK